MNPDLKSQEIEDFYLGLLLNLFSDCVPRVEPRDLETAYARTRSEGLSFLTKTLPSFGKSVISALNTGLPLRITNFKKKGRKSALPSFLKGLTEEIFDDNGVVLECPSLPSITELIQLTMGFYKLEVDNASQYQRFERDFVRTDCSLPETFCHFDDNRLERIVLDHARDLISGLLAQFDPLDFSSKHGPGAVATGEKSYEKYHFKRIFPHTEKVYPASIYYFLNDRDLFDRFEDFQNLEYSHAINRVTFVPKDSRGPRTISMEPLELQYLQQGLGRKMMRWIDKHPWTRGYIPFYDQDVNGKIALQSSITKCYSTIDLSSASDRVSCALVDELFAGLPKLLAALRALRSEYARLPSGKLMKLRKYAPMGSALCFPVESVVFWALSHAIAHVYDRSSRRRTKIYVFGDDIIVPARNFQSIVDNLHYFGLRVNEAKSCHHGYFRESCGVDAYKGEIITPVRVKKMLSPVPTGNDLAHMVSLANHFESRFYRKAAEYVRKRVRKVYGEILYSPRDPFRIGTMRGEIPDSAIAFYSRFRVQCWEKKYSSYWHRRARWNSNLQRLEHRAPRVQPVRVRLAGFSSWKNGSEVKMQKKFSIQHDCDMSLQYRRELLRHFDEGLGSEPGTYGLRSSVTKINWSWTSLTY